MVLIEAALEKSDGMVSLAADSLKLRRTTLIEKMKKFLIQKPTLFNSVMTQCALIAVRTAKATALIIPTVTLMGANSSTSVLTNLLHIMLYNSN